MKLLIATNDIVTLSFAETLLREADIPSFQFDRHQSTIEGSIGIIPRRLMVDDGDWDEAVEVLEQNGLGAEVKR